MIALEGIPLVAGIADGLAVVAEQHRPIHESGRGGTRAPREQFNDARCAAEGELRRRLELLADGPARQILRAHLALIADPMLETAIAPHLHAGLSARDALERARSSLVAMFEALNDPLLRARAADLSDICDYVARHLGPGQQRRGVESGRVVCAVALSPAQVLAFAEGAPLAFVVESRAETSHAAILMRALGVPTLIGVDGVTALVRDGDRIHVDGDRGRVILDPRRGNVQQVKHARISAAPLECDGNVARTRDGALIAVTATIGSARDARDAIAAGADGIGLFRTEWLFMQSDRLPSEDDQAELYRDVAGVVGDRPITVRVADLGGDKRPQALHLAVERNPALGLRGVRLLLAHPGLLETQVRALTRAFHPHRLRVMLPMVTDSADVVHARKILDRVAPGGYAVGAMIETPAAALMTKELAAVTDFLSLGTNDLTQYVLAADRDDDIVGSLCRPVHPAMLRLVRSVAVAATSARKPLSVCGESARDPLVAPLLVGMGVTELSVSPDSIATTKRLVRELVLESARVRSDQLAALPTAAAVSEQLGLDTRGRAAPNVRTARDAR